jgi:hypothetical protein
MPVHAPIERHDPKRLRVGTVLSHGSLEAPNFTLINSTRHTSALDASPAAREWPSWLDFHAAAIAARQAQPPRPSARLQCAPGLQAGTSAGSARVDPAPVVPALRGLVASCSVDATAALSDNALVSYETFLQIWLDVLRASRLPQLGVCGEERLDTRNLDRSYQVYVEPFGGQDTAPFHVTAELSWVWTAGPDSRSGCPAPW